MQEWKMQPKTAGLENARLENVAQKCRTWKCRKGKYRTRNPGLENARKVSMESEQTLYNFLHSIKWIIELRCKVSSKFIENCCRRRSHRKTDRREIFFFICPMPCTRWAPNSSYLNFVSLQLIIIKFSTFRNNSSKVVRIHTDVISEFCGVKLQQVRHKAIIRSILRTFEQIFINPDSVLSLRLLCKTHIYQSRSIMIYTA